MSQQQIEARAVEIQLLGLVILTDRVRPDSKSTISELQEGYVAPDWSTQSCSALLLVAVQHSIWMIGCC